MAQRDPQPPHEELVSHAGFLRALARGMLADEHLAEDVVQQAFLLAVARPPRERGILRVWLARVVGNLALNEARGAERRRGRERAAARSEVDEAHERAALELALQREVAAALAELGEPARTIVHLRYFRGHSLARIASELALTPRVVETRLARAHEGLRRRLARAWNEQDERLRATWLAALPVGKGLGGLLMAKSIAWVGVGGALMAGLLWTWRVLDGDGARAEAPAVVEEPPVCSPWPSPEVAQESAREPAVAEPEPVLAEAEPGPTVDPDEELRSAMSRLAPELDRSLDGHLDPGLVLDTALLLVEHELGVPEAEPDFAGRVIIPFEDLPDGVRASLCVPKQGRLGHKLLTLEIELAREGTRAHGGWLLDNPSVSLTLWRTEKDEFLSLGISTEIQPARRAPGILVDPAEWPLGISLHTPFDDSSKWNLSALGLREVDGTLNADGGRSYKSDQWEIPQLLEGGPWPRVDDMRRFATRLQERHESAKRRSER